VKEVKFPSEVAASRATQASHGHYGLSPREAYVLRSAPVCGLRHRGETVAGVGRTMWLVGDENLGNVVEGLLLRGFLARSCGVGAAYADLTAEGRMALESAADRGVPMTRTGVPQIPAAVPLPAVPASAAYAARSPSL
jgi:hypothetical protein